MNVVKSSKFDVERGHREVRYSIYCSQTEYEFIRRSLNTLFVPFDDDEIELCRVKLMPYLPVKVINYYLELISEINKAI